MADYLSKADWRKHLKLKEHKKVKKTGISDLIDAVTAARKANDTARLVSAYDALALKAEALKKDAKVKDIGTLTSYLDSMIRDAKAAKNKVQVGEDKEADPSKKVESPLDKQLQRLKQLDRKSAWNFIAAPGKPSSGLVLSRRDITPQDRKTALDLRGKAGPFFSGRCYGEKGRFVFELEDAPPKGLAKGIKLAAKIHADSNIRVLVRGAGIDITDEDDADLDEVGREGEAGPVAAKVDYPSREVWAQRLQKLAKVKPQYREEAAAGILGQVKRLLALLADDRTLSPEERAARKRLLEGVRDKADQIARGGVGTVAADRGEAPRRGNKAAAAERKAKEQSDQYQHMTTSLQLVDKAALPKGGARAIAKRKKELQADKGLTKVVMALADCETDRSPKALAKLTKACDSHLKEIAKQKKKAGGDEQALALIGEREKITKQTLQQVRLLELAEQYRSFGPPPWDEEKSEQLAELQMTFLFEEAAVKRGLDGVPLGLPPLGDEGGVNESYWVKRVEGGYGGNAKGESLYIFKPGESEDGGIYGMPSGHGAPREVLAKSMSDQLAEHGFDIGVCPTTLTRVDTAKLGADPDSDPGEGGRTLGAMQALASNRGEFKTLRESGSDLGKKIDSRNYGDIAVFDLIYFNMDRHGGNLLLGEEDPTSGTVPLIPIDHGLGLPNAETLYMNSSRLLETQNTLMNGNIPQKDELLHEGVRGNLKAMNPVDLVEGMRRSRDAMAKRHSETAGTVTDEALAMMERRIAFLQFACDHLTVKQLNEANAICAYDINNARTPRDFQKIVDRIKQESGPREEGRKLYALWGEANPDKRLVGYLEPLKELGWCTRLDGTQEMQFWLDRNADLAAKIIKGRIPNPAAIKEISQRIDMIGEPGLHDEIKGKSIREQLAIVRNKAPYEWEKDLYGTDEKQLRSRYKTLGGDGELEKAVKVFALTGDADQLFAKVEHLVYWTQFNDQGGLDAYFRLGGEHGADLKFVTKRLSELQAEGSSRKAVLAIDDGQLAKRQAKHLSELASQAETSIKGVRHQKKKQDLADELDALKDLTQKGKADEAQAKLMYFGPRVRKLLADEAVSHKNLGDLHKQLKDRLDRADRKALGAFGDELEKRLRAAAEQIEAGEFAGLGKVFRELKARFDIAELGDESEYRKLEVEIEALRQFGEANLEGGVLDRWRQNVAEAGEALKAYDMASVNGPINAAQRVMGVGSRVPGLKQQAETLKGRDRHGDLLKAIAGIERSIKAYDSSNVGNHCDYAETLIREMTGERQKATA